MRRAAAPLLLGALLAACASGPAPAPAPRPAPAAPPAATTPAPVAPAARWLGVFEAYPQARELCAQHVTAGNMHISWTAHVTTDRPQRVVDFYAGRHPDAVREGDGLRVAGPGGERLSVHPAAAADRPRCGTEPGPADRTVIVVSRAQQR